MAAVDCLPLRSRQPQSQAFGKPNMKRLIYFIIICVIGYFAWSYFKPAHAPEQSIQGHEVLTLPPALPAGKPVNDSFESLVAGAEIYNDVTVRMVFPDSIAIIHRDGAITIPLAKVSKDIQRKYSYDPAFAEEYVSLKAAHAQYKKAKLKEEERAKAESSGTVSEPEKAQAPSLLDQLQQAIPAFASSSSPSPAESPTPTHPATNTGRAVTSSTECWPSRCVKACHTLRTVSESGEPDIEGKTDQGVWNDQATLGARNSVCGHGH